MFERTILCLSFALLLVFGGSAQTAGGEGELPVPAPAGAADARLYADLLEGLLARDYRRAEADLRELRVSWPDSPLTGRASEMLRRYGPRRDTSGIVPFYIGSLVTGVSLSVLLPSNLIGLRIEDQVTNGLLYLGGAGLGLGSAWILSREGDFGLAKELWIESATIAAAGTWYSLYEAWYPASYADPQPSAIPARDRVESLGLAALLLGGRTVPLLVLGEAHPSLGRAAFAAQSSAWTLFYASVLMGGILEIQDPKVFATAAAASADGALVLGALAWDGLGWSAYRSGLVSVGGVAGFLFAAGVNMVLGGLMPSMDPRAVSGLLLGGALGGQALAVALTRGMGAERLEPGRLGFSAFPAAGRKGWGLALAGRMGW